MELNTIKSATGARVKRKRAGRGIGSGLGKTCGRGHKGQKSRTGGKIMAGFEGGQMPLHRRLPKVGFSSRKASKTAQVRICELALVDGVVDLESLKKAGVVADRILAVKVFDGGELAKKVVTKGVRVSASVREKIEALGGKVE